MSQSPAPPGERSSQQRTWLRDAVEVLVIALVIYVVIWTCIQTVKVDGRSTVNTLQNGDLLIASKISYRLGSPERGDIVILTPPPYCDVDKTAPACQPGQQLPSREYIKRVIGLPGDNVEIDGNQHPTALLVQPGGAGPWTRVTEPYLPNDWVQNTSCCAQNGTSTGTATGHIFHVTDGMYFVMGDNRNESNDSRFFGLVPRDKIEAKAVLRIWPFDRFGGLGPQMTLVTIPGIPAAVMLLWRSNRRLRRELAALTTTTGSPI